MQKLHGAKHFQQSGVEPVGFVDTLGAQAKFLSFPPSHIQPETRKVTMLSSTTIRRTLFHSQELYFLLVKITEGCGGVVTCQVVRGVGHK